MHEELVISGSGGQGILFIGKLLCLAALKKGRKTTWFPSYGPLMRTGEATCTVIISSDEIGSPISEHPDSLIVMHGSSLKFAQTLKPRGLLMVNESLIDWDSSRDDLLVLEIKATDIAKDLGDVQVANLVMLGVYLKQRNLFDLRDIKEVLRMEYGQKASKKLIELNERALELGFNGVK